MVWEGHGAKFPCPHPFPSEDVDGGTEVTVDLGTAMRVEGFVVLPLTIGNQTHLAHDNFTRGPGTFELDVVAAACGETEGPERH